MWSQQRALRILPNKTISFLSIPSPFLSIFYSNCSAAFFFVITYSWNLKCFDWTNLVQHHRYWNNIAQHIDSQYNLIRMIKSLFSLWFLNLIFKQNKKPIGWLVIVHGMCQTEYTRPRRPFKWSSKCRSSVYTIKQTAMPKPFKRFARTR